MTENKWLPILVFIAVLLAAVLLVSGCAVCRWAGFLPPLMPLPDAPKAGAGTSADPFPWQWPVGFLALTVLAIIAAKALKLDFLREEILAGGVGLAATMPIIVLTRAVLGLWWQLVLVVVVCVGMSLGWKLLRRRLGNGKPPVAS